ncbi:MAG: hypothetical protein HY220_03695 [Candidatus Sungbacteria bacterium]|uniref:Uncharacterized protein n=1 Tax=Candidatus Sungiibacteriota bacterium TaxID=2750080 RepID=A0A9D6LUA3_9BACT|nr:hypothetical protein [Candidatus Sungbacteria bacterium]
MSVFPPPVATFVRAYCPGCEPDADPFSEILDTRWCEAHQPPREGADDGAVDSEAFLSGSSEAGGDSNRAWCAVLHGDYLNRYRKSKKPREGG